MKELNTDQWSEWLPVLESTDFSDLSPTQQTEALALFGDEATYQQYRMAYQWGDQAPALLPVPNPRAEVKTSLDILWEEEATQRKVVSVLWWQAAAASVAFLVVGWYLGYRNPRVEYLPGETQVVVQTETVVDTVYQEVSRIVYQQLPADTVFVETPVYLTISNNEPAPVQRASEARAPVQVSPDDPAVEWMNSLFGETE